MNLKGRFRNFEEYRDHTIIQYDNFLTRFIYDNRFRSYVMENLEFIPVYKVHWIDYRSANGSTFPYFSTVKVRKTETFIK